MKKYLFISTLVTFFSAKYVYAESLIKQGTTVKDLIGEIMAIFAAIVPLLVGAAVVVFLYGVLVFIAKASRGDADGRKEGINFMIFGIIGIAVMVSLWGLVAFVTNTLGTNVNFVPQFNTNNNNSARQIRMPSYNQVDYSQTNQFRIVPTNNNPTPVPTQNPNTLPDNVNQTPTSNTAPDNIGIPSPDFRSRL